MAATGKGTLLTIESSENRTWADANAGGGLPAGGQDMGATADAAGRNKTKGAQVAQEGAPHQRGEAQRAALLEQAEEALVARERANQPAATALRNGRAETRRSTRTHEDITDRQKDLHVIPQRRAAEEEKKKRRLLNKPG